ncbi:MAG: hypothetical protein QM528_02450 [Phycisphaerales bacterium]|nr:hypothetical protein [Phycisphaerales bacterium]
MTPLLLNKLLAYYPHLLFALLLSIIVWRISSYYHRFIKLETGHAKIETKLTAIESSLANLSSSLANLSASFNSLVAYLSGKDNTMNVSIFVSKSPMELTPIGTEILELTGGKKYIDTNLPYLISEMEKEIFKSGLDVEIFSKNLLIREINSDGFTPIKNYIFNNPVYKKDDITVSLNLDIVIQIIGIYLRNQYFVKYPQLTRVL